MRGTIPLLISALSLASAPHAQAKSSIILSEPAGGGPSVAVPGVLQCVPFARETSGIRLHGDAHTWWSQAAGKYDRGRMPKPGAVLAIQPYGNSRLGHVATVSRVIDARTILISHANWSAPGKIERNVTAVDVSPANDWSEVRVWYAPIASLGGAHWPVSGFIYNAKASKAAKAQLAMTEAIPKSKHSKVAKVTFGQTETIIAQDRKKAPPAKPTTKIDPRKDPIGAILASAN